MANAERFIPGDSIRVESATASEHTSISNSIFFSVNDLSVHSISSRSSLDCFRVFLLLEDFAGYKNDRL